MMSRQHRVTSEAMVIKILEIIIFVQIFARHTVNKRSGSLEIFDNKATSNRHSSCRHFSLLPTVQLHDHVSQCSFLPSFLAFDI